MIYTVVIETNNPQSQTEGKQIPMVQLNERVKINQQQVERVAKVIKHLAEVQQSTYTSNNHPPIRHPSTLDYFFAVTLQQFGFWEDNGEQYLRSLIARIDGKQLKGSAYMAKAYLRLLDIDPQFYSPDRQASLQRDEFLKVLCSDDGRDPLPALNLHLKLANKYGQDLLALDLTPLEIINKANAEKKPLQEFLRILDSISGYKEDPLRKKANLLAMILSQRPERFLNIGNNENLFPIVDYHCMRACLRLGLIDVVDSSFTNKLTLRLLVTSDEEWAVRHTAYQIQLMIEESSGKSIGAINQFFFNYMRRRCHEMTTPDVTPFFVPLVMLVQPVEIV